MNGLNLENTKMTSKIWKSWWDAAKNYMRTIAVSYAPLKSQIKRDVIKNVENQNLESKDLLSDEERKNLNHFKEIFLRSKKIKVKDTGSDLEYHILRQKNQV